MHSAMLKWSPRTKGPVWCVRESVCERDSMCAYSRGAATYEYV